MSGSWAMQPTLNDFSRNEYSQFGEDGIVEKIFECIGTRSRVCVEFGAWHGFHISNTAALWTRGWKAVLIEGHARRCARLRRNVAAYDCVCIRAYVAASGSDTLEALLDRAGVGADIDLLSIDIDGDDYYIFESLSRLHSRVVIVEYNPTVPAHLDLYAEPGSYFGASVAALARVGRQRGYTLVAVTQTNCFLVTDEELPKLAGFDFSLERLRNDNYVAYLMTDQAGDYVVTAKNPYGYGLPYRGGLRGPHAHLPHRALMRRPFTLAWRWVRDVTRPLRQELAARRASATRDRQ